MSTAGHLDRPIFILGLHRTGSTLCKNVLDANSHVVMISDEMDISDPWRKTFLTEFHRAGDLSNSNNFHKFINRTFSGEFHGSFWGDLADLSALKRKIISKLQPSDLTEYTIITTILDEYRIYRGGSRVGVKYPVHFSRVELLKQWYPDARFIFLTRDPRAIIASKLHDDATVRRKAKLGAIIHYFTLAFFVLEFNWFSRIYYQSNDIHKLIIRYEDLVSAPEEAIRKICDFCEIPFESSMMQVSGKSSSHSGVSTTGFDPRRIYRWKTVLNTFDQRLIETFASRSMGYFGYSTMQL